MNHLCLVSTFPPDACGIASYTHYLSDALGAIKSDLRMSVVAEGRGGVEPSSRLAVWRVFESLSELMPMPDNEHNLEAGRHGPGGPPPGVVLDRTQILAQLEDFVEDAGRRMFILTGMHGIGKTAVADELARRADGQKLFDETIRLDCRREERSADAFVDLLHSRMGGDGENREFLGLLQEESRDEQWVRWLENAFVAELGKRRYLVILDDFESWVNGATAQVADDAVRRTLLAAASGSHHSKLLLITAHRAALAVDVLKVPFGVIEEKELLGLPPEQAVEMLIGDGMSGVSPALLRRAAETFVCNPLALRLFAHLTMREHRDPAELLEAHGAATVIESLIGTLLGSLSPEARDTVELLAVFRRPVRVSDLEAADFDCGDVRPLADRFIVRWRPDGVVLEPLFRAHTLALLQQDRRCMLHERAASFWGSLGSDQDQSPSSLDAIWPALEHAFHLGQTGSWSEAADVLFPAAVELLRLMYSDVVQFWETAELLRAPQHPWEFMQLGNCGSPLETPAGWLLLTHGVGPMRTYSIGAMLLDLNDPCNVIGHLDQPLLMPTEEEREGYVPNVVYTCGALIHDKHLYLPYAMSDSATGFAIVPLDKLLERLT